jgi:hypothetical protein
MRGTVRGMRVLGLAIMSVLGMATGVGDAQVQLSGKGTLGQFLVNLGTALLALVESEQIGISSLLVPARNYELKCKEFHIEGKINSSTDAQGQLLSLGCLSYDMTSGELLPCELKQLGTVSATALVLPILHGLTGEEQTFLLFEPLPGNPSFTTVAYKAGTECPLPLNNAVIGSLSAQVDSLDQIEQLVLYSKEIQLLTGDSLSFGLNPVYIDRQVIGFLAGSHAGQKVGIH